MTKHYENSLGQILDWRELLERTASRIVLMRENSDVSNNEKRSEIINWMKETPIVKASSLSNR